MLYGYIPQARSFRDFFHHFDLFADGIDQVKMRLREKYGQRYAWKSPARAEVHHFFARAERMYFGDSQGMQDVPFVQLVDIFPGNHVDLRIPVRIKIAQRGKLFLLFSG
ncbi:MAG: hypothetical protein FD123_3988 [Bacteroidetes bacterium]|nr:MAG: hypothetical protein FD123_3988 [Bacteroidota bacterium]